MRLRKILWVAVFAFGTLDQIFLWSIIANKIRDGHYHITFRYTLTIEFVFRVATGRIAHNTQALFLCIKEPTALRLRRRLELAKASCTLRHTHALELVISVRFFILWACDADTLLGLTHKFSCLYWTLGLEFDCVVTYKAFLLWFATHTISMVWEADGVEGVPHIINMLTHYFLPCGWGIAVDIYWNLINIFNVYFSVEFMTVLNCRFLSGFNIMTFLFIR